MNWWALGRAVAMFDYVGREDAEEPIVDGAMSRATTNREVSRCPGAEVERQAVELAAPLSPVRDDAIARAARRALDLAI